MNHLYVISTGILISSTSLPIPNPPVGTAVKVSELTGIWNVSTLDFDPYPEKNEKTKEEFFDLFTDTEFESILDDAKKTNGNSKKTSRFMKRIGVLESVDLKSTKIITLVNEQETLGFIAPGRAAVILNG